MRVNLTSGLGLGAVRLVLATTVVVLAWFCLVAAAMLSQYLYNGELFPWP